MVSTGLFWPHEVKDKNSDSNSKAGKDIFFIQQQVF
jgi:hypothetical protein